MPNATLLKGFALLLSVSCVVLLLQSSIPSWRSTFSVVPAPSLPSDDERVYEIGKCSHHAVAVGLALLYSGVLVFWGANTAWQGRNIPSDFNETSHIATSIMSVLVYASLLLPVQVFVEDRPVALAILRSLGTNVGILISMVAIYMPKLLRIYNGQTEVSSQAGVSGGAPTRTSTSTKLVRA